MSGEKADLFKSGIFSRDAWRRAVFVRVLLLLGTNIEGGMLDQSSSEEVPELPDSKEL